jgi:hypothetical protein
MNSLIVKRIGLAFALLAGVFLLPYWLTIFIAAICAMFIPYYFEFIGLVVIEEMLYHSGSEMGTALWYPIALFAFFILLEAGRNLTRERFLRI